MYSDHLLQIDCCSIYAVIKFRLDLTYIFRQWLDFINES